MRASIKNINLPPTPPPTRAVFKKQVNGLAPKHLEVDEYPRKPRRTAGIGDYHTTEQSRANAHKIQSANAKQRHEMVMRLANEGKSYKEIAVETGYTVGSVGTIIKHLRKKGCEIPYRKKMEEKNG